MWPIVWKYHLKGIDKFKSIKSIVAEVDNFMIILTA